jgi:hypothetical protein
MDLVFLDYGARKHYLNPFIGRYEKKSMRVFLEALRSSFGENQAILLVIFKPLNWER